MKEYVYTGMNTHVTQETHLQTWHCITLEKGMVCVDDGVVPAHTIVHTHTHNTHSWYADRSILIALIGTFVVLPLCYPKRLGALAGMVHHIR